MPKECDGDGVIRRRDRMYGASNPIHPSQKNAQDRDVISTGMSYNLNINLSILFRHLQPTTYNLQPTTYNLQPTTYNLQLHLIPKKYCVHQQFIGSKPESAEVGVIGK